MYQNKLDKPCFQHDMAYGYFEDLTRRTASGEMLWDKAYNIAKNSICDWYQRFYRQYLRCWSCWYAINKQIY